MSDETPLSVLQRKAQAGQERYKARAMTAARALRVSAARAAEEELELALGVIGLTEQRVAPAEFIASIEDTALMILLETAGRGSGAAILDQALVGAIVQQQTMGRVTEMRADASRKATRTDAALVASWLDRLLKHAETMPDNDADRTLLASLRYGAHMAEERLLTLALDAPDYVHFSIVLDIAAGMRQGKIEFVLPTAEEGPIRAGAAPGEERERTLEPGVMTLRAPVRAALCRLKMSFSELAELVPGDEIPLPEGVVDRSEILTMDGRLIASGKLGQAGGFRALRVAAPGQEGAGLQSSAGESASAGMLPGMPDMPDMPASEPDSGGLPGLPDLPGGAETVEMLGADLGDLPDLPDLPDIPDLSEADALPDLPSLPDLPPAEGSADADDLPDLPALPDLPDLPDLPMVNEA